MSVQRSQSSVQRGKAADYVVEVGTEGGSASDVSVTLTAKPAGQKPTFSSGCAGGNGSASCAIASVTAKTPVVLHAQIPVAPTATSVTSVTLTATATITTTATWTPPTAAETVTVTGPSASPSGKASSAKASTSPAQAATTLPLGPYPNLNGLTGSLIGMSKDSLIGAGNVSGLFPKIGPSATPTPAPASYPLAGQSTDPVSGTSALAFGKPTLTAQVAGLIALAVAIMLTVTRLSVRRRSRSKLRSPAYFLATSSTAGRNVRIVVARAAAFIVGETISPKLSSSNQAHIDAVLDVPTPCSTHAASPPRGPAETTTAPGNFCVKLAIDAAGAAFAR